MNKQVYTTVATLTLFAMLLAPVVYAQSSGTLVANIPFDFKVGKTALPSGEYTVRPLSQSAVCIQDKNTGQNSSIVLTMAVQSMKTQEAGKLVFNRYGNHYFLSKIWHPANSTGRELLKSRAEIELAKGLSKSDTTILAAKK